MINTADKRIHSIRRPIFETPNSEGREADNISIVYCADRDVQVGLLVSIFSLCQNSRASKRITVITSENNPIDLNELKRIVGREKVCLNVYEINEGAFKELTPLVGSVFPYSKLLLSSLMDDERVIYIDCDTIVNVDVSQLWEIDTTGSLMAAVRECSALESFDWDLLRSIGTKQNEPYINSGVFLANLANWRSCGFEEHLLSLCRKHARDLKTADQTVFNLALDGRVTLIDSRFNVLCPPGSVDHSVRRQEGIFHFIGSPKPWDFLSHYVDRNHRQWHVIARQASITVAASQSLYALIKRTARISRGYARAIRRRLF